jgi:hypothetical protein
MDLVVVVQVVLFILDVLVVVERVVVGVVFTETETEMATPKTIENRMRSCMLRNH